MRSLRSIISITFHFIFDLEMASRDGRLFKIHPCAIMKWRHTKQDLCLNMDNGTITMTVLLCMIHILYAIFKSLHKLWISFNTPFNLDITCIMFEDPHSNYATGAYISAGKLQNCTWSYYKIKFTIYMPNMLSILKRS